MQSILTDHLEDHRPFDLACGGPGFINGPGDVGIRGAHTDGPQTRVHLVGLQPPPVASQTGQGDIHNLPKQGSCLLRDLQRRTGVAKSPLPVP